MPVPVCPCQCRARANASANAMLCLGLPVPLELSAAVAFDRGLLGSMLPSINFNMLLVHTSCSEELTCRDDLRLFRGVGMQDGRLYSSRLNLDPVIALYLGACAMVPRKSPQTWPGHLRCRFCPLAQLPLTFRWIHSSPILLAQFLRVCQRSFWSQN
jgi:hypothetical protein